MANNPFVRPTLTGFNSNPPPDDGSEVADNEVTWAKSLEKHALPLKTFAEALADNTESAFAKTINTGANENNALAGSLAFTSSELTIAAGSITATRSFHTVDTESDAASDDLDTIVTTGVSDGALLFIGAAHTDRTVVVKHGTGNILLPDDADIPLDDTEKRLVLQLDGSNWVYVAAPPVHAFETLLLHVRDEKSSGTAGGAFSSGSYQTRPLNTVVVNEISGASLGSNQITLPAGSYFILASAPGRDVVQHKAILYNTSDSSVALIGTAERSENAQTRSFVTGRFTIAAEKTFELRHRCAQTRNTDGFGVASTFGEVEVYGDVMIWKVA